MAEFGPDIAEQVVAACQAAAEEIAEALARTFDTPLKVATGQVGPIDLSAPPEDWDGPGLVVQLNVGDKAALVMLAESSGLIPSWYESPDATGASKLTTLAQELGMLVLPEQFMPEDFRAARVEKLREAVDRAKLGEEPRVAPLELTAESGGRGTVYVVWAATQPGDVFAAQPATPQSAAVDEPPTEQESEAVPESPAPTTTPAEPPPVAKSQRDQQPPASGTAHYENLPSYARSLLRTSVPVSVTLANKKQPVSWIIELGPGSIIQFDKACEDMLSLEVNGHAIAEGEAVKVGERFGIRLTSLKLPDERFHAVQSR